MIKRYDLKDFRPSTLTTVNSVAKAGLITDGELFQHLNSCPFFHTYNDGEVGETEKVMLPFFRRFLKVRNNGNKSYMTWLGELNDYLLRREDPVLPVDLKKYIRYFTNLYTLLHPSKKFEVVLPYFPYRYSYLTGCAEAIIKTKSGIRIYVYEFEDKDIDHEKLNFDGFRLQLAARIFHVKSGIAPTSLACIWPGSKAVVYYTYNENEKLENMIVEKKDFVRRYGSQCAYCLQRDCTPLIDRTDRYGWRVSEKN
jgi:hypothetical protein